MADEGPSAELSQALAAATPQRIREVILQLAAGQPVGDRNHVEISAVLRGLLGGIELPPGSEGWNARLRLERAIAVAVAEAPGMSYLEGDS